MELKDKLISLRSAQKMTQAAAAERLGVSAQTVSKWERGLLSPDIYLLPKIALLYNCSIDSLFDMETVWSIDHRKEFEARIHELHAKKDYDGVYSAWIREIELNPDNFMNYCDVMLHVLRKGFFDDEHVSKMISLAEHAEKHCQSHDIRSEINKSMVRICASADNPKYKAKAMIYYKKLAMLRHCREPLAEYVYDGEDFEYTAKYTIMQSINIAECAIRQLIRPEMHPEEKLYYYEKAAAIEEPVLDDKYAGIHDVPLLCDYKEIVSLLAQLGEIEKANDYINRIKRILKRHLQDKEKHTSSKLIYAAAIPNTVPAEKNIKTLLNDMLRAPEFEPFQADISELYRRFTECCPD